MSKVLYRYQETLAEGSYEDQVTQATTRIETLLEDVPQWKAMTYRYELINYTDGRTDLIVTIIDKSKFSFNWRPNWQYLIFSLVFTGLWTAIWHIFS